MEPSNPVATSVKIMPIKVNHPGIRKQSGNGFCIVTSKIFRISALGVLFIIGHGFATTVVVLRSPGGILIGTDSRINEMGNPSIHFTACKIFRFGDMYLANAGMYTSGGTNFNVLNFAAQAAQIPGSLMDKVAAFHDRINAAVAAMVDDTRRNEPAVYDGMSKSGIIFEATFVQMVRGVGEAITKGYYIRDGLVVDDTKEISPGDADGLVSGKQDAIQRFIKGNPNWYLDLGAVGAVSRFIDLEIIEEPDRVGPPIAILKIAANGSEWIQQGVCPDDIAQNEDQGHPKAHFNAGRL
jgi:hypothetical protein